MKILKRGKLREVQRYLSNCTNCGCKFSCLATEILWEEDRGKDYPTIKCPCCGLTTYPRASK